MIKYLWLLEQREEHYVLDEVDKFVVSAENEERARFITTENPGDEGPSPWKDPGRSTCKKIGIAFDLEEKIIIRDKPGF